MATITDDQRDAGLHHRRAVVLNADVVGYSRLLADDPAATVAAMRDYQDVVDDAIASVGGSLVNFVGDSFVAVFDDARTGMHAAIAICRAVKQRNAGVPRHRRMFFRMGLDAGEIVVADDGGHFGDPLNIAARIQGIAEVGGINVTETIYAELDEPALRLVPLGPRRLKNIPETIRVYRLVGLAADDGAVERRPGAVDLPTVAVLPFHGRDAAARDVAAALQVDVVTALAAIPGLRVREVTSSGDADADHGADCALTGGVVSAGPNVRVYVQLSDTSTVNRVWAQRWDGATDDLFTLQDAVTDDTVRGVEIELVVGEPARIYRSALAGDALEAVYRGLYQLLAGPRSAWRASVELFASLRGSPAGEVVGMALGAFSLWWGVIHGFSDDPEADLARAGEYAARGIELGDDTGLSHMVIAALRLHDGGDPRLALADARRAVALRPTCDVSFAVEASVHRYLGEWQAAVEASRRALALSPLPRPWFSTVLASAYYVGERYQEAADTAEHVLDLRADELEALLVLAAAQQALGLERRAKATVETILARFPTVRRDGLWRHHPYRDPTVVERWTRHLDAAGLP